MYDRDYCPRLSHKASPGLVANQPCRLCLNYLLVIVVQRTCVYFQFIIYLLHALDNEFTIYLGAINLKFIGERELGVRNTTQRNCNDIIMKKP